MKKTLFLTLIALLVLVLAFSSIAVAAPKADKDKVNTITQGEIYYFLGHYLEGKSIPTEYDGYN